MKTPRIDLKSGLFHGRPIYVVAILVLLAALVVSVLAAVTFGSVPLSVGEVYGVILHKLLGVGNAQVFGSGKLYDIVWFIRLPRVIMAVGVGMALAVSGCVMQAIVRNPLADPYILGISSGATLGATVAALLGVVTAFGANAMGICAFLGALAVSILVQIVANIGGRSSSIRLLGGLIYNERSAVGDESAAADFARAVGTRIAGRVPLDRAISRAEMRRSTVIECEPDSAAARAFEAIADEMLHGAETAVPELLSTEALEAIGERIAAQFAQSEEGFAQ